MIFGRTRFDTHPRIDDVTRFWRREQITRLLEDELDQSRRERQPVGIMLVAVDRYDDLLRELGPSRAEAALSDVAQSIRFSVRPHDLLGSWGPGSILVVLSGCDLARAAVAGERLRQNRASRRVDSEAGPINVTITVAVASSSEDREASAARLTTAVDHALALAIRSGGNRTRLASLAK
jgi:diguanylate cyclase (GGDEF)-like protein